MRSIMLLLALVLSISACGSSKSSNGELSLVDSAVVTNANEELDSYCELRELISSTSDPTVVGPAIKDLSVVDHARLEELFSKYITILKTHPRDSSKKLWRKNLRITVYVNAQELLIALTECGGIDSFSRRLEAALRETN